MILVGARLLHQFGPYHQPLNAVRGVSLNCPACNNDFAPKRRNQKYCSVLCRNRFSAKGGTRRASGLALRNCEFCGIAYTPYRANQRVCSKRCYRKLPEVVSAQKQWNARPETRERKNVARRTNPLTPTRNFTQNVARYGLTVAQYEEMLADQNGCCAICGDPPDPNGVRASSRLHIDHCHTTSKVRGLLCNRCNRGVGYFKDDEGRLSAAIDYLRNAA